MDDKNSEHRASGKPSSHTQLEETLLTADTSPKVATTAMKYQLAYSILGLVLASALAILGLVLVVHGATSKTSWTAELLGLRMQVTDAVPGVTLMFLAVFLGLGTRYVVKVLPAARLQRNRTRGQRGGGERT